MDNSKSDKPWYREFWVWFILAPLIASIVLSMIMVTTAVRFGDDEITDDYYKKGRMINQSLEQTQQAAALGIKAQMDFDMELGDITLRLESNADYNQPESLHLSLDHPFDERQDTALTLKQIAPGFYRADLDKPLANRWYIRLAPEALALLHEPPVPEAGNDNDLSNGGDPSNASDHWRLVGEIDFSFQQAIYLQAP